MALLDIDVPEALARSLAQIAGDRGLPLSPAELAEAVRLCEECRRADAGEAPPGGLHPEQLLPVAVPCGCLVVRTPTIRARLKLIEIQGWPVPAGDPETVAEYVALLTAWILDHGRDGDEMALLAPDSAPAIVADLRPRMGCTLGELQQALRQVVTAHYPEAELLDRWADADQPRHAVDWAQVILALAAEGGCSVDEAMSQPETSVQALFAGLRRRQAEIRASIAERKLDAAPDPDGPKARAAFAWVNFERALRAKRRPT